ncbi:calcium-binding protein [Rhizobium sp. BK068]|uniref:calcium-binding protein n=2 Tax=unclassified Rhizobium TaxID=2613769 RepID=UPI0010473813|nr:calcium-binding protein [Rhizobium sp. BK068]TCM65163.1 hemolysin type calcium-binding protein [Rhizobium sp. BK068]
MTITVKLTSADLAAATSFGDLLSFDTALASVYYPDYDEKYGFSLLGQKVYDAVAKEAILYVDAMVNSYTNALLFGIKNYLTFDPTSNGGWRIEGNNGDNGDLAGTDGDDTVFARGGNDSIDASTHGGGYDRYDGGDGVDTISYATSTENLTISHDDFWGEYSATGSSGESDTFTNIERIIGGLGNDSIAGSDADETFAGGGGNDTINGGGGVNTVDFSMHTASVTVQFTSTGQGTAVGTQNGQDSFAAIQNVIGSQGNDTITGDSADNIIDGQNGSDQIDGGAGFDTVAFLNSIASYTIIVASGGHLQIWDHTYTDTVINVEEFSFAGVAFTYAAVQAAAASMTLGTSGGDSLTGSTGGDAIFGGAGSDTIFGLAGNDLIYGEDGDDVIFAGDGTNNINGGNGSDTVIINGAQSDFTVTVQRDHSVLVTASGITNRIADVEWIAFDAPDGQDDTSINVGFLIESNSSTDLTGSGGNETLTGTAGHDTIHGLAGNDTIYGLQGDDTIDAGAGDDVVFAGTGKDIVDGGDGVDTVVIGGAYTDFAISVRDDHSILISGNGVSNTISHAEWIVFDTPDSQNDTSVSVSGLIEAQSATAVAGTISADTLTGTAGQDTITGLGGNDTIYGLAGDDVINAGDGDDVIFAGVGANLVDGGNGSDTLVIDGAYDDFKLDLVNNSTVVVSGGQLMDVANNVEWIVFDAPGTGTDHSIDVSQFILQNSTHTLEGTSGADTLNGGAGLDTIHGQDGDDTIYGLGNKDALYGQAGNDILFGGDGDDIIVGGDGDDFLVGGGGTDTFAFDPSNGQDWIDDFDVGVDKIDVSAIASLHDFSAVLANAQEWVSGTTWLYADVNNYVRLEGVSIASLQANDFVFA